MLFLPGLNESHSKGGLIIRKSQQETVKRKMEEVLNFPLDLPYLA